MPNRTLLGSLEALVAGAADRVALATNGKSGARLERVTIDDAAYVVKHLDESADWTLRAAGVPGGATAVLWERGILDELPACLRQPIVAVARDGDTTVLLMEDVSPWLVPDGDAPIPGDQQGRFLDHMAAMHATFWDADERFEVVPVERRYLELSPQMAENEARLGSDHPVPRLVARGWPLLSDVAPKAAAVVVPLVHDPSPLVRALASTPQTFVHGNWKIDNLGTDDHGRTVVLDWELPGRGAPLSDLAWYLAINCRRLASTKEAAIEHYRVALEGQGVDTEPWWRPQLALCLVGGLVQFGWEKALGGYDDELAWWEEQVVAAAPLLAR